MPATKLFRTEFLYNNYMYMLAGYIAEKLTGKTWEDLVQEYIFTPLGMNSSGFVDRVTDFKDFALPYVTVKDTFQEVPTSVLG